MGRYTSAKHEFDQKTKEILEGDGYQVLLMGGGLADLVGWHLAKREFVITEVKSPAERDADIRYRYKRLNFDLLELSRQEVWRRLQDDGLGDPPGISRLVAFTVSNQLYGYWRRSQEHITKFQIMTKIRVEQRYGVTALLALPSEYSQAAQALLEWFRDRRMIKSFGERRCGIISLYEISYPQTS
jgi:hypothetical protein